MQLLTGRQPCQLDANNRLAIPAKFRELLGQEGEIRLFVSIGQRPGTLDLWPVEAFKDQANRLPNGMLSNEAALEFAETTYIHSELVRLDKQGRLVIPEILLAEVPLSKELMLAGMGNRMTIWPKALYEQMDKDRMARYVSLRDQARRELPPTNSNN